MNASSERLGIQLERLKRTANRIEKLHAEGKVAQRDVDSVYEGLYVRSLTVFEAFIEDLFFDIMLGRVTYPAKRGVAPKVRVGTAAGLYAVLKLGRSHLDWLPYVHTQDRAKVFLRLGRPFCELDASTVETIYRWTVVRNRIAHDSREAEASFTRHILNEYPLPPRRRNPVGFLRQIVQMAPPTSRFEVVLGEMAIVARDLSP